LKQRIQNPKSRIQNPMCPDPDLLERFALGRLSEDELAPVEEHLEACERCLQTLLETSASDTVIEALRDAPRTLERRAEIEAHIRRVEAAFVAQLREPRGGPADESEVQSPKSKVEGDSARLGDPFGTVAPTRRAEAPPASDETPPSGSVFSAATPQPDARTEPDEEEELYDFLAPAQSPDELGRLGGYRVLRVLGTGGMGVVFEAEDPQLKRRVALKVMKPGVADSTSARKRFLREAQTAASVEHDHIVPVYQVGEDRGVPFIAMPLLRGETLAERLERVGCALPTSSEERRQASGVGRQDESVGNGAPSGPRAVPGEGSGFGVQGSGQRDASVGNALRGVPPEDGLPSPSSKESDGLGRPSSGNAPLPTPELVRIGRELALGLAAAHRRGLIHRDIKPSNIWLEEETGRVKILDFGLARASESGEQLTQAGSLLGTPAYMSPEQASGGDADARSDLFSLGCVLYHCATGRRPFIGRDALSTLVAVTTTEPPLPRELNPTLPDDLNDLIVSLLSKDPAGRPQSAREVAERLVGWALPTVRTDGLSIQTDDHRPPDRSMPSPSATAMVGNAHPTKPPRRRGLVMLAAAAAALLAGIIVTIKNEKDETIAQFESDKSVVFDQLAPGTKVIVEEKADDKAEGRRQKVEPQTPKTQDLRPKTSSSTPKSKIENPKSGPPPLPSMSEMALVTEPTPIPGAKSWTLETIDHRGDIYKMEFNPDGTLLATYGEDGAVRLWNSETGELARIFVGADSPSGGIAWSPDGASIAVAAGARIRAWQAATGKNVCTIALADGEAASLAWSPDGSTFAVGQRPLDQPEAPARHLCLYDASSGKLLSARHRDDWSVEQIAWSPDGKRLLIASGRAPTFLAERDAATARVMRYQLPWTEAVAWTPDGVPLAAGIPYVDNKPLCQLWRDDPPELLQTYRATVEGERPIWTALSADGRFVVAGCGDTYPGYPSERAAYVFEAQTGNVVCHIDHSAGHPAPWKDGSPIYSWEYAPRYAISRDGRYVARCGQHLGGPAIFRSRSGSGTRSRKQITMGWEPPRKNFCAKWSNDGASLAWRGEDGAVRFWPRETTSAQIAAPAPIWCAPYLHPMVASDLHWSWDDRFLVSAFGCLTRIDQYSPTTGELESRRETSGADGAGWLTLSPDGNFFAGNQDWRVRVFETASSKLLKTLNAITGEPVRWSPDARQIAVRNGEATEIWNIEANECVRRFDGGRASLVWSPDGSRFVLSGSGEATIHDAASGNVLHEMDDPPAIASVWPRLSWTPDSRHIAGRGRVWDAETGEFIGRLPRAALAGETGAPAWSSDGTKLAYLGPGRSVVVANVAPKVRHSTAQGETLGNVHARNAVALKGRDSPGAINNAELNRAHNAGESRPVGADNSHADMTQGSAALHPGLWNLTPSGSPRVAAMLLTFNRGQVLSIAPSGHYRASPRADELLAYVVETADGQETLSREQFAERFGWKNDAAWATHNVAPTLRGGEAVAKGDRLAPPSRSAESTLSDMALVQRHATLSGVETWTIAPRAPQHPHRQWQPINLSKDGTSLARADQDGTVRLIDTATGKVERLFVGHDAPLTAVAFSPDAKLVASLDCIGGNARIWDVATGRLVHSVYTGTGQLLSALHWSPDGSRLAISAEHAPLRLLDVASGEFLPRPIGHSELPEPDYFAWSPDGRRFVSSTDHSVEIRIWDASTLEPAVTLESKFDAHPFVAFGWSPDGSILAACAIGEIRVWNSASGKLLRRIEAKHAAWGPRLAWLPDNKTIAISTGEDQGGWQLWDVVAGRPASDVVKYDPHVLGFSMAAGGKTLSICCWRIGLFDVAARALRREIESSSWAESAAWSPDGRELAVTGDDMAVWSNNRNRGLAMFPIGGYGANWLANGEAILHSHDAVHLYLRRGQHWDQSDLAIEPSRIGIYATVALSPDGKRLACDGRASDEPGNKRHIQVWDIAISKRLLQTEPLGQYIEALAWSPDGALLAAGTYDGASAIYDAATGKRLAKLPAANAWIRPIEFSPDGKTIAVGYGGSGNGFVRLYDVEGLKASGVGLQASDNDGQTDSNATGPHRDGEGAKADEGTGNREQGTEEDAYADAEDGGNATRPHPGPGYPLVGAEGEGALNDAAGDEQRDHRSPHAPRGEPDHAERGAYGGQTADAALNPKSQIENPKSANADGDATRRNGTESVPYRELTCSQGPQEPEICALHWSADGRTLHVLDRAAVYVFDATTGERLAEAPRLDRTPHRARPANFSPDGRFLAVATTCTRVWDVAELNEAAERSLKSKVQGPTSEEGSRVAPTLRGGEAVAKGDGLAPPSRSAAPTLKLVASVVPLGHGQAVVVSADGHWLGTRGAEKEIVYVIKTAAGQETLTPREFYKRFGWKNDPSKVALP
jgi:WD40 repeat protein